MRKQSLVLIMSLVIVFGWYLFPTKYDRLMSEALKKQKEHPELTVFDGEIEPPMPDKSENDKTVLGIDSNHNGIRDDIDIWINRTAQTYNERMAMRQYTRSRQKWLEICTKNISVDVSNIESELVNSGTCLKTISNSIGVNGESNIKLIDRFIQNNSIRNCGNFYNENSTFITAYGGDDFDKICKFKILNIEALKVKYLRRGSK